MAHTTSGDPVARRHRPKTLTVFAAAFAAGAVLAYGVDRVVDVHVVQVEPQVESEPIFVALRSLPQGAPLTVWDVALKDWPKAMLPTTALKADAALEGMVLRHPIREGQPLLSVQLVRDGAAGPVAGMAALPAAAGPAAAVAPVATDTAPVMAMNPNPGAAETFVPATPAEPPVAATQAVADVAAAPAATRTTAMTDPTVPSTVTTDTDIDPSTDPSTGSDFAGRMEPGIGSGTAPEPAPPVVDSEAVAADAPAAAEPVASAPAAEPLVAPVPALPTTDIGQSLVAIDGGSAPPTIASASVLDRRTQAPAPQAPAAMPRYHLVVPERVALAADASFAQRPAPQPQASMPVTARPPATVNAAPKMNMAPSKGAAEATRSDSRRSKAPATFGGRAERQERQNAAARNAAALTRTALPPMRQPAAVANPGATKPADSPQPSRPMGLGAWFPQFSGSSRQR